ncbi:conjugal transfer protein [Streptomyces microflavus]|uniref:conjugal transfer protein n=1 Tax=Streptomyces microflavus TaxID=1919 RepID=UPI0033BDD64F
MKSLIRRRPAGPEDTVPEDGQDWAVDSRPEDVGGWSSGAQANTSALLRWCAWALLILGPLLAVAALVAAPSGTGTPVAPAPPAPSTAGSQGSAGFAVLFVDAYLRAGEGDQEQLAAYYPDATVIRLEGEPGRRTGQQLTVVRLRQTSPGIWSVTVAARVRESGTSAAPTPKRTSAGRQQEAAPVPPAERLRYFQVPVATTVTGGTSGYVALSMPAEVAAPPRVTSPELLYGPQRPAAPTDPRTQAVTEFLTAYLTGRAGDIDRYLAPGTRITPISPAPYTGIAVDHLAVEGERGGEATTTVPADGTRLRLLVSLRATGSDTVRRPLAYALTLTARAGRWEIAELDGAPTPAPAPLATTASAAPTN